MTNGDWLHSEKSRVALRFFFANSHDKKSLPITNLGGPAAPGFPVTAADHFGNFSVVLTYLLRPYILFQAEVEYNLHLVYVFQAAAIHFADSGVKELACNDTMPILSYC